jgi:hypothetical protein
MGLLKHDPASFRLIQKGVLFSFSVNPISPMPLTVSVLWSKTYLVITVGSNVKGATAGKLHSQCHYAVGQGPK